MSPAKIESGQNSGMQVSGRAFDRTAEAQAETMEQLVNVLAREPEVEGRVVRDETGLMGRYDFTLKWTVEQGQLNRDGTFNPAAGMGDEPSLFAALREQLGLKLESKKGAVDTIVIVHIERPSID